jgi:hypothetical protein
MQAFRSKSRWGIVTAKVIAAVGTAEDMVDITRRGMHRPATWCANACHAVLVIITATGVMAAETATRTGMDIRMVTGMGIATK